MLIFIDGHCKEFLPKERNVIAMLASNKFISDKQSKIALQAIEKAELEGFGNIILYDGNFILKKTFKIPRSIKSIALPSYTCKNILNRSNS